MNLRYEAMMISIDPSSTTTGYALYRDAELINFGAIKTKPAQSSWERTLHTIEVLRVMINVNNIDQAVIEIGTRVHSKIKKRSMGSGLAVYGMAVGAILYAVGQQIGNDNVHQVEASTWTRLGNHFPKSKGDRTANLRLIEPKYAKIKDPGDHISDAIYLGRWWLDRRVLEGVM